MPIKKLESERETLATVVERSAAMSGKPGRYISIEKGPIEVRNPRISISENLFGLFMLLLAILCTCQI